MSALYGACGLDERITKIVHWSAKIFVWRNPMIRTKCGST
jgi:hypothetical protein